MKHRPDPWRVITCVLIVAGIGVAVNAYLSNQANYHNLLSLYAKQQTQLKDNGITPSGPSPAQITQGTQGATGAAGANGRDGNGISLVECTSSGLWRIHYTDGATQTADGPCVGAVGTTGAAGANGADSTVAGPKGDTGDQGPAGAPGTNGTNGEPPASWTYSDMLGVSHTCARDDPFDPTAPTYNCT